MTERTNPDLNDALARECLTELADVDFQESAWTSKNAAPDTMPSYVEAVCGLFEDSNLGALLKSGWVYGEPLDELLRQLDSAVDATPDELSYDYDRLFENSAFRDTRRIAAQIVALLVGRPIQPLSRQVTESERRLIERLLEKEFAGRRELSEQLDCLRVWPLDSNGSLRLAPEGPKAMVRERVPAEASYRDADGTKVNVLLHVVDGLLNELEFYRDDSERVSRRLETTPFDDLWAK